MKSELSDSTVKLYQTKIAKLSRLGITDFSDTAKVIKLIQSISDNLGTQKTYFQAIAYRYPQYFQPYKATLEDIYTKLNDLKIKADHNPLTSKQQESFISWEEIIEVRDTMAKDIQIQKNTNSRYTKKQPYKQLLLLSLYTYIPPRRIQDFVDMYCYISRPDSIDTKINYYIQSEKIFIFNSYKTSTIYGSQTVSIPPELYAILDDYIRIYQIEDGSSLLNYSRSQNLSDAIGDLFFSLTQKRITPDILRHAYCIFKDTPGRTAKQIRDDSVAMSHSVNMEVDYVKDVRN